MTDRVKERNVTNIKMKRERNREQDTLFCFTLSDYNSRVYALFMFGRDRLTKP